jgi:hypothetical protein
MNPAQWKKLSSAFEKADTSAAFPSGPMNFMTRVGNSFPIANFRLPTAVRDGAVTLKALTGWWDGPIL